MRTARRSENPVRIPCARRGGLAFVLAFSLLSVTPGTSEAATPGRIAGATRGGTAIAISQHAFPFASVAYLAQRDSVADALAAGSLNAGPLLLVPKCGRAPQDVVQEIRRLGATSVWAIGGPGAICDGLLNELPVSDVGRLAGTSRFGTAVAISQHRFPASVPEVYLANAFDSPDGIVAGTLGHGPILLVPATGDVPREVRDEVRRLGPRRIIVIGGEAAISDDMARRVAAASSAKAEIHRAAGNSRYETAIVVSQYLSQYRDRIAEVYLARSDAFADALAAGSLQGGPVLLVPRCGTLPPAVRDEIDRLHPERVYALGGSAAVCASILQQATR